MQSVSSRMDSKHGFVSSRSCLTSLIMFFQEVTKVIDDGRAADVVYMDFSKAFEMIFHGRLIQNIKIHQIHSDLVVCIRNWLTD